MESKFLTRVHVASWPIGLRQKCFRCDAVLSDLHGVRLLPAGTDPMLHFFKVGSFVGVRERTDGRPHSLKLAMFRDRDATESDELPCRALQKFPQ